VKKLKVGGESQDALRAIRAIEAALKKTAPADSVELALDVILARNDVVHHRGYRNQARRFFGGDNAIRFSRDEFRDALRAFEVLASFFEKECKAIGKTIGKPSKAR